MSAAVLCADCGSSVDTRRAELTAHGWRCQRCALQHQIDVHGGADEQLGDLSLEEMQERASRALSLAILAVLAGLVVGALLVMGQLSGRGSGRAFWAVPASITFAGYELVTWRKARNALAIMRRREAAPTLR